MQQALNLAVGFLTRLPTRHTQATPRTLAQALIFFPWVGAALGALLFGAAKVCQGHLPSAVTAILLVTILAGITGALHLDGVADVFDALGGGRGDRARTLEIMRDSRIGAHGACALVLVLILKVVATQKLLEAGVLWPLWAAPMLARATVLPLIVFFPYARPQGLGMGFRDAATSVHVAVGFLLMAPLLGCVGKSALAPAALTALIVFAFAQALHRRLGGLTGDVYGAAIELGEITCLVGSLVS